MIFRNALVLLFLCLGGCATTKPFDIPNANNLASLGSDKSGFATIYVFRDKPVGLLYPAKLEVDAQNKGWLSRNSFQRFNISPGKHELRLGFPAILMTAAKDIAVRANFDGNVTYYFLFNEDADLSGLNIVFTSRIQQIDEQQAWRRLHAYSL